MSQSWRRRMQALPLVWRHAHLRQPLQRYTARLCAALLIAACGAGDDGPPDPNPSLDQWCNGQPCGWSVELGQVKRVSTWHNQDYAVEFEGPGDVQLSQVRPAIAAQCLVFDVVTQMDEDARLTLRVDFNNDGRVDWFQSASELDWKSVPFSIPTPTFYDSVRFIVLKEGPGKAVVAQIVISGEDDCPSFPLLLDAGSRCEDDSVCEDDLACVNATCQEAVRQATGSE